MSLVVSEYLNPLPHNIAARTSWRQKKTSVPLTDKGKSKWGRDFVHVFFPPWWNPTIFRINRRISAFSTGESDSYRLLRWYSPLGQFHTQWNFPNFPIGILSPKDLIPTRPNPTHTNRWRCSSQWDRKGVHFINVLYVFCLIVKQLGNFDHLVQENVLHGAVIFRFLFVDEIIIKN